MQKRDKLVTITVKEEIIKEEESAMKNYLKSKCDAAGITKYETVFLPHNPDLLVYQVIKEFLKEQDPLIHGYIDFVAVGNQGANFESHKSEQYLGSVSNTVLRAKKMNCIFVP